MTTWLPRLCFAVAMAKSLDRPVVSAVPGGGRGNPAGVCLRNGDVLTVNGGFRAR